MVVVDRMEVAGLDVEECKVMSSKQAPLWLTLTNADPEGALWQS